MPIGVPGKIRKITGDDQFTRTGDVDFGGCVRLISLTHVPDAKVGDWLLVHTGCAINIIDEERANQILNDLNALAETEGLYSKPEKESVS